MTGNWFPLTLAVVAFLLGASCTLIWWRTTPHGRGAAKMSTIRTVAGAFFTVTAITLTVNLLYLSSSFNDYVDKTVVRDSQQEACQADLLLILGATNAARRAYSEAQDEFDTESINLVTRLASGDGISQDEVDRFRKNAVEVMHKRYQLTDSFTRVPLGCHKK